MDISYSSEADYKNEVSQSEPDAGKMKIVNFTSAVKRGESATITVKGKPLAKYTIKVVYSSGASQSKDLKDKETDNNGYVTWTWKVSSKTKPGNYSVEIWQGDTRIIDTIITIK